ncbi:MAG: hypothetical protein MK073_06130 [Phycisphaerales bacterium]|nr:hypothetical protein [Phycisphaerales bacterium]
MDYKKIVLQVLYCSIGIAVAAGIIALFTGVQDAVISRLIGTSLLTAASTCLLLVAIRLSETDSYRPLSFCISVLTHFIYFFFFTAIWCYLFRGDEDVFMMSALMLLASTTPLCIGSTLLGVQRSRISGWILIGTWGFVTLWWIADVWNNPHRFSEHVGYTIPIAIYGTMAAFLFLNWNQTLIWFGLLPSAASFVITEAIVFFYIVDSQVLNKLWGFAMLTSWIAASLSLPNMLFFRTPAYSVKIFECITTVLIVIALGFVAILIYYTATGQQPFEWQIRFGSGFSILASSGVLGTLAWQSVQVFMIPKASSSFHLDITCPRCSEKISLFQGKNNCPFCNLYMQINFAAPNCGNCQYDLTKSNSNTCPECGNKLLIETNGT